VVNFFNNLWRPILGIAEKAGAKAPTLCKTGFRPMTWPSSASRRLGSHQDGHAHGLAGGTPLLAPLLNRWLAPLTPHFCVCIVMAARPKPRPRPVGVSVFGGHSRPQRGREY